MVSGCFLNKQIIFIVWWCSLKFVLLFQLWISRVSCPAVKAWSESKLSGYLRLHTSASGCKKWVNGGFYKLCAVLPPAGSITNHIYPLSLYPSSLCVYCLQKMHFCWVPLTFSPCCLLFSQTEEVYGQTVRVQCWC